MDIYQLQQLLDYENILNQYSGKRYHIISKENEGSTLYEVESIGKKREIISTLSIEQMLVYLKKHLKVNLDEQLNLSVVTEN